MPPKDPRRAALLSALWSGLGQLWLGQRGRGLALMVLWPYMVFLTVVFLPFPFLFVLWVFGIYDAHQQAMRLERRAHPPMEGPFRTCAACGTLLPADYRRCPDCDARVPPLG